MNGIYIHLPFCRTKCHYCDFYSYIPDGQGGRASSVSDIADDYAQTLVKHIRQWAQEQRLFLEHTPPAERFQTVFFGGGTPSFMPVGSLQKICQALEEEILGRPLAELGEVTIEANPESFNLQLAQAYEMMGINRISMGIQALSAQGLAMLGRDASLDATLSGLAALQKSPQKFKSADLIFGYPGQSETELFDFISQVVGHGLDHVSLYGLTLEKGTEYARLVAQGRAEPPDDEFIGRMYGPAGEHLASLGLGRYEISNFARPGHWCRHNIIYWSLRPYLGFGVSAHGLWNNQRYKSAGSLQAYFKQKSYYQSQDKFEPAQELVLTQLRLTQPISVKALMTPLSNGQRRRVAGLLQSWLQLNLVRFVQAKDLTDEQFQFVQLCGHPQLDNEPGPGIELGEFMVWQKEALPFFDTYSLQLYQAVGDD